MRIRIRSKILSRRGLLILVLAITAVAIVTAIRFLRTEGMRCASDRNMVMIYGGLSRYHLYHGCFPPANIAANNGKRMHSWRVLILYPIKESPYSRYKLDEPWNSPANLSLAKPMPTDYRYPADTDPEKTTTDYVAVVGADTMWPGNKSSTIRPGNIDSGKILVLEIPHSDIHWMEPRDLTVEQVWDFIKHKKAIGNTSEIRYLTVGGDRGTLDSSIDRESLLRLLIREHPPVRVQNDATPKSGQ